MLSAIVEYEFVRNMVLAGVVIGVLAPLVGVFLVTRRLALMSEALSHITLTGIASGMLLNSLFAWTVSPYIAGTVFAVTGSVAVEKLSRIYTRFREIAIPIVLSTGLGMAVVLISASDGFNADLAGYLFGSVVAVTREDLRFIFVVGMCVIVALLVLYRPLFAYAFDPEYAALQGRKVSVVQWVFIIVVACTITAIMRIVGILLVTAMLTIPVATSLQVASSFKQMIWLSIGFAQMAFLIGIMAAYSLNWPTGATVVLVGLALLTVVSVLRVVRKKRVAY